MNTQRRKKSTNHPKSQTDTQSIKLLHLYCMKSQQAAHGTTNHSLMYKTAIYHHCHSIPHHHSTLRRNRSSPLGRRLLHRSPVSPFHSVPLNSPESGP